MAGKPKATAAEPTVVTPPWVAYVTPVLSAVGRFIDKFGVSFVFLVLFFVSIRLMGSEKTQDDFVRELLFSQVTQTHYLQALVALLIGDAVFGVTLMRRWLSREKKELQRCAEEKAKLQAELAGRSLARTADHVNNEE